LIDPDVVFGAPDAGVTDTSFGFNSRTQANKSARSQ
jgi:hypothetical protein